jgi:hypothetical protein
MQCVSQPCQESGASVDNSVAAGWRVAGSFDSMTSCSKRARARQVAEFDVFDSQFELVARDGRNLLGRERRQRLGLARGEL